MFQSAVRISQDVEKLASRLQALVCDQEDSACSLRKCETIAHDAKLELPPIFANLGRSIRERRYTQVLIASSGQFNFPARSLPEEHDTMKTDFFNKTFSPLRTCLSLLIS